MSSLEPNTHDSSNLRTLVWSVVALLATLLLSWALIVGLLRRGEPFQQAIESVGSTYGLTLQGPTHEDSWEPMLEAFQREQSAPSGHLYDLFLNEGIKFQYPPSSLLVFDLMPDSVTAPYTPGPEQTYSHRVEQWMTWPARLACLLVVLCSALLVEVGVSRLAPSSTPPNGLRVARFLVSIVMGLTFYPLLKGYDCGQVQIFINAFVALALLLHLLGYSALASVALGLCCLIKPQYAVLVLLALVWKNWRFFAGFVGTAAAGLVLSLLRYGFGDHVQYLQVLRVLSRRGESYWPNQSLNGVLNRFFENGDAIGFMDHDFPPPVLGIYLATTLGTLGLIGLALWNPKRAQRPFADERYAQCLTLGALVAAVTLGSPVAWEHHYGWFLAYFALLLPGLASARPWGDWTAPAFCVCYVLVSNELLVPSLMFENRWVGLVGSHLYFAALSLFALGLMLRRSNAPRSVHSGALALSSESPSVG